MPGFTNSIAGAAPNVDLHLLRCFDALVATGSVTLAADTLEMSQPGMSNALARLRKIFGDPILYRTARGMAPTDRALLLWPDVQAALRQIGQLLARTEVFEPASARGQVRIASTDAAISAALAPVIASILEEAPGIQIHIQQLSHVRVQEPLETGAVDLAFGFYPDLPATLYSRRVLTSPTCCIVSLDSPLARGMKLRDYARAKHVRLNMSADFKSTFETLLDQSLARLRIERAVAVSASSTAIMAALVSRSSLVGTVPAIVAQYQSQAYRIATVPSPLPLPDVPFSFVWHARSMQLPHVAWIREKLAHGMPGMESVSPPASGRGARGRRK